MMSRSDFLTYSTYAALDVATAINNRDCRVGDTDCFMPEMEYREVVPWDWDMTISCFQFSCLFRQGFESVAKGLMNKLYFCPTFQGKLSLEKAQKFC